MTNVPRISFDSQDPLWRKLFNRLTPCTQNQTAAFETRKCFDSSMIWRSIHDSNMFLTSTYIYIHLQCNFKMLLTNLHTSTMFHRLNDLQRNPHVGSPISPGYCLSAKAFGMPSVFCDGTLDGIQSKSCQVRSTSATGYLEQAQPSCRIGHICDNTLREVKGTVSVRLGRQIVMKLCGQIVQDSCATNTAKPSHVLSFLPWIRWKSTDSIDDQVCLGFDQKIGGQLLCPTRVVG